MEMIFDLSSGKLMVATSCVAFTLPATSGRGACENSSSKNCLSAPFEGPIPIGKYFIDPKDLSDPNLIGDIARNYRPDSPGDWGDFRVRLQPLSTTNTHGRDGFFLHGGSYTGSAGCIDVGGGLSGSYRTDLLKTAIKSSPGDIFFGGETMIKGIATYSAALLSLCILTIVLLRITIPNDHSYASMALMVLVFVYPFFVKASIFKTLGFGIVYTCLLSVDSAMGMWLLSGPKTGESVVLILVAGTILTALNMLGFAISNLLHQYFTANGN